MTAVFLDTEFIANGNGIDLVSLGATTIGGFDFYAENSEADLAAGSPWVQENVILHLKGGHFTRPRAVIASSFKAWVDSVAGMCPIFWADSPAFDWVAVTELFGTMHDRPAGWPYNCFDLRQRSWELGVDPADWPSQSTTEHHALADAHQHLDVWVYLEDIKQDQIRQATKEQYQ